MVSRMPFTVPKLKANPVKSVVIRYLSLLQRYRFAALALTMAVTAVALYAVFTLRVETDWTRLLPYAEELTVFRALHQLGSSTEVIFHIEDASGAPISTRTESVQALAESVRQSGLFALVRTGGEQQALEGFSPELTLFLGTEGTRILARRFEPDGMRDSVGTLMDMMFSPASAVARGLLQNDPLQISALALGNIERSGGYTLRDGLIQSEDGRYALFLAIPPVTPDDGWMARLAEWIPKWKAAAQQDGLICRMPGSLFLRAELFESVKRELIRTSTLAMALILLLFLAVYRRSLSAALCVILPQGTALAVTFALYRIFSAEIGLITSMAAAMLTGLGVDFGIHLMARYRAEEGTPVERLTSAILGAGRGNLAGALSTSIAFFAILVTGMRSFYLLGCTAGFGILISVFTYFLVFPLLVFLFNPFKTPEKSKIDEKMPKIRLFSRFSVVFALLILLLLPFSITKWRFSSTIDEFLPENSLIYQDMLALDDKSVKMGPDKADCLFVEVENRDFYDSLAFCETIRALNPSTTWQTPFTWIPEAAHLAENRSLFTRTLAEKAITPEGAAANLRACYDAFGLVYPDALDRYLAEVVDSFKGPRWEDFYRKMPFSQAFFSPDGASFFMTATKLSSESWTPDELAGIQRVANEAGLKAQASSSRQFVELLRRRVIPDTMRAGVVTFILMIALLKVFFRRWTLVALTLTPLTLGLVITVTVMGLLGQSFNYFNLTVLPLIFGLGIDDGIHYVQSSMECGDPWLALRRTIRPIILTTVTTCIGFGTLMFVSFYGIWSMGLMMVIGMLSCLLAVLVFLPVLTQRTGCIKSLPKHELLSSNI